MAVIARSGSMLMEFIRYIGQLAILSVQTLYWTFAPPFKWERVLSEAKRVGPDSFLIAALVAFFTGVIISLQMAYQMVQLSAEIYIPNVVAISLTRELAPVLTALVVAGRVGAGITAQIGTMRVTEQVDALKAFAVNPVQFLVVPRLLSLMLMLPILTIFADLIGIFGGFIICVYKLGITSSMFFGLIVEGLAVKDIVTGLIKAVFFGMIIAVVGCHRGLNVRGGAEGVGRATTQAVVASFMMIIVTDCVFTTMFYFLFNA